MGLLEWLESVAEFRGGSGELESGGSGRVKSKGVGSVIQPVYSHIPRHAVFFLLLFFFFGQLKHYIKR